MGTYAISGNIRFLRKNEKKITKATLKSIMAAIGKDISNPDFSYSVDTKNESVVVIEPKYCMRCEDGTFDIVVYCMSKMGFSVLGTNRIIMKETCSDSEYSIYIDEGADETKEVCGDEYILESIDDQALITELEKRGYKCMKMETLSQTVL